MRDCAAALLFSQSNMSNQKLDEFTIETLLSFMAKLKSMKDAARQQDFKPGSDPRYAAVQLKTESLLVRLEKLIPAVMLAEVAALTALTDDLYLFFKERESSPITEKGDGDGH